MSWNSLLAAFFGFSQDDTSIMWARIGAAIDPE
jgi:hypothetical protein